MFGKSEGEKVEEINPYNEVSICGVIKQNQSEVGQIQLSFF